MAVACIQRRVCGVDVIDSKDTLLHGILHGFKY